MTTIRTTTRTPGRIANTTTLHSGGPAIEYPYRGFPQSLQANSGIVCRIRPRPLPSTGFINHPIGLRRRTAHTEQPRATTEPMQWLRYGCDGWGPALHSVQGSRIWLFSTASVAYPTDSESQGQRGRSIEINNAWTYTSSPPYVLIKHMHNSIIILVS